MLKTSSIRSDVSQELRLVTDTDGQGHRIYRASMAPRGKNRTVSETC